MGVATRVWCEDLMTRTLSSQALHHDTLLWPINVVSVYHLLTDEGSLMGMGDLASGEDCCLRKRKEKFIDLRRLFVILSCLGSLHSRFRSSRIVHSFLTYPCSNVLGQNTENYYIFYQIHHWHTFGSHITRSSTTARHHDSRSNMLLTSFPGPTPSRASAHPSLPRPPFAPKARAFTKHKGELLKCSD